MPEPREIVPYITYGEEARFPTNRPQRVTEDEQGETVVGDALPAESNEAPEPDKDNEAPEAPEVEQVKGGRNARKTEVAPD